MLEDVHWVDPTTLELIGQVPGADRGLPRASAGHVPARVRPRGRPRRTSPASRSTGWRGRQCADVARLCRRQGAAGGGADQIVARTDGVPLFVEELTKTVLEFGLLPERRT